MSRRKGSKNRTHDNVTIDDVIEDVEVKPEEAEKKDTEDETVSIYEASQKLSTSELTIKTWVDHGHLSSINGRIPVRSIIECRFNTRRFV